MACDFKCRLVACFVTLAAIILLQAVEQSQALESHYESYEYQVTVAHYQCYPYSYTYCYNWWYYNYWWWGWRWYYPYYWGYYWNPWYGYYGYWNWCYVQTYYNCYYYYTTETRIGQRCASKWVGSNCNIPTCSPACQQGMVCSDVDKCTCAGSAGGNSNCQILPCSPTNNCYPGTCENNVCKCPPGFNGTNCERILQQPTITRCGVSLTALASSSSDEATQVAQASCARPGESPIVVWVNGPGLNSESQSSGYGLEYMIVSWTPSYVYPISMPTRPAGATTFFISNAPVAIYLTEATYTLTFPDSNNYTLSDPIECPLGSGNPTQHDCVVTRKWNELNVNPLIGHNKTVIVSMSAKLGGFKSGDSTYIYNNQNYGFQNQPFTGVAITYSAAFKFDLVRPTHCLLVNSSYVESCTGYPIQLEQDIRSDPAIRPVVTGWLDDGSGIAKFRFQVFFMQPDAYGILSPNGDALPDSVATLPAADIGNYRFTVPAEGTYSIIVTVYDHANNSAQARKIFNYINSPSYTIDVTQPVYLQEADSNVNYTFITKLTNSLQVNLVWTGRFKPTAKWQTIFAARVNALGASNGYTIDDVYGTRFGQRSIAAHDNQTGISSYTVRWYVDDQNGGIYAQPDWADNTTTKTVTTETTSLTLSQPLTSGSTIVVWFTATGVTRDNTTYRLVTHVDTSPPNVTKAQFVVNGGDGGYYTRFTFTAYDLNGGISAINYTIIDKLNNNNAIIPSTSVAPTTRQHPSTKRKRDIAQPCSPSDTSCYCTPFELCYDYVQIIDVDNCNLDRYKIPENFDLVLRYWVINLAGLATAVNTIDLGDISEIQCRPSPTSVLAIVLGIILGLVGLLFLIFVIVAIVVVVRRVRANKSPIPNRSEMRAYAGHVRNRFTMKRTERASDNDLYAANNPPPAYTPSATPHNNNALKVGARNDDDMYVDKNAPEQFKISRKQVQFGDVLAEGRFAVVRRGYYIKAKDKQPVAVKALRNGYSQQDELLMAKKVAFMKGVPKHGNLVAFHGFVDENDGQGDCMIIFYCVEGQMMVLELCDFPMTDWLKSISSESDESELVQMLTFALNIAHGVQHLHNNQIIHRRLAVRNVLIKQQVNGLVAKLIGFGPTAEDVEDSNAGARAAVAIPKKWLAPETLESNSSRNLTYNEKTDAWSYGVTIWEIFSKGATPYPDVKSNDIYNLVKRGKRLSQPADCPEELYNEVMRLCWADIPVKRPTFHTIQDWIQKFRSRIDSGPNEYYAAGGNNDDQWYTTIHD